MLVRRDALAPDEPLFDPGFFMYFEDSDLCLRLRRQGWQLAVVTDAEVVHLWQLAPHKEGLMAQAAQVYFAKHFAGSRWLRKASDLATLAVVWPLCEQVQKTQALTVPEQWRGGWVLELGLSPLFAPAVACLGDAAHWEWPSDALAALGGGQVDVFARLGPLNQPLPEQSSAKPQGSSCVLMQLVVGGEA